MSLSIGTPAPFRASLPALGDAPGPAAGNALDRAPAGSAGGLSAGKAAADTVELRLPPPVGVFTALDNDAFSLRELVEAGGNAFDTVARYRVALRDATSTSAGGRLELRGNDVTGQLDFTAAEFNELQFVAGADGSRTDLLVVARSGRVDGAGTLTGIVDSRPVQLAASVVARRGTPDGAGGLRDIVDSPAVRIIATASGERSLNALAALRTAPEPGAAARTRLAQDAEVFDGLGGARPHLTTVGNFTAAAADAFSVRGLFDAGPGGFDAARQYRVALSATAGVAGTLSLRGVDVSARQDFTAAEFNELQFIAGPLGSATGLTVVARNGREDGAGGLTGMVDSPAVEITATTTARRSLNAVAALRTELAGDADARFLRLAQDADLFGGAGVPRPTLASRLGPAEPALALATLAVLAGTFRSFGGPAPPDGAASVSQLAALYSGAVGSRDSATADSAAVATLRALLLRLDANAVGGFRQSGGNTAALALAAYGRVSG